MPEQCSCGETRVSNFVLGVKTMHKQFAKGGHCVLLPSRTCGDKPFGRFVTSVYRRRRQLRPRLTVFDPPWLTLFGSVPLLGAADAESEVSSVENTEPKGSPFKAWSRLAYSHACYAYCRGFLPCLFLPFRSIHLLFFFSPKLLPSFSCVGCG